MMSVSFKIAQQKNKRMRKGTNKEMWQNCNNY